MSAPFFVWDDIRIGLIEDYGILYVKRPVFSTDSAELFQQQNVVEYINVNSNKTAVVGIPNEV